ncbi:MAG: hypothetical protein IJW70_08010 [Clostridia bacterium]|nr:hypothetical protein [Clostridia bacterium]
MMQLYRSELRKLCSSRTVCIVFIVLLCINFLLTAYLSKPLPHEDAKRQAFEDYLNSPEQTEQYYKELKMLASLNGREEDPNFPYSYYGSPKYDDFLILRLVYQRVDYIENGYAKQLDSIISMSERKLDDMYSFYYDDGDYEIKEQKAILERYRFVKDNVQLPLEYAHGYDTYIQNNTVSVFVLLCVLVFASYLFLDERASGFESILRSAKHGQGRTFIAKALALLSATLFCVVVFSLTTFAAVGIMQGYSDISSPIQVFEDFTKVPFEVSILGYMLLQLLVRFSAFVLIAAFASCLACLKVPYIASIGGGIALYGVSVIISNRTYMGTTPAVRYLNPAAMIETCALLGFDRYVSLFTIPVPYLAASLLIAVMATAALFVAGGILFCKNVRIPSLQRRFKIPKILAPNLPVARKKYGKVHTFAWYELKKSRFLLLLAAICVLLAIKSAYMDKTVGNMESYDQAIYYEYVTTIQPMDDNERAGYMRAERERIDSILLAAEANRNAFSNDQMTAEDYFAYCEQLTDARARNGVFARVENYVSYIERKNAQTGGDAKIIYSIGYEHLYGLPSDVFVCAALMLLCVSAFAVEYRSQSSMGGFSQILRVAKHGRIRTFACKMLTFGAIGAVISIVFRAVTLWIVSHNYVLPDLDAALYSIQAFTDVNSNITIGQYMMLDLGLQVVLGVLVSVIVGSISCICRRPLATISVSLLAIGLPEVLASTVLPQLAACSVLSLSSPLSITMLSAQKQLPGGDFTYLLGAVMLLAVLSALLTLLAGRRFCKSHYHGGKS